MQKKKDLIIFDISDKLCQFYPQVKFWLEQLTCTSFMNISSWTTYHIWVHEPLLNEQQVLSKFKNIFHLNNLLSEFRNISDIVSSSSSVSSPLELLSSSPRLWLLADLAEPFSLWGGTCCNRRCNTLWNMSTCKIMHVLQLLCIFVKFSMHYNYIVYLWNTAWFAVHVIANL